MHTISMASTFEKYQQFLGGILLIFYTPLLLYVKQFEHNRTKESGGR